MDIRIANLNEVSGLFEMIKKSIQGALPNFYPQKFVDKVINEFVNPDALTKRITSGRFYVAIENNQIIGCGCIKEYWENKDESVILTVFVAPEFQNKGIGKRIITTLINDDIASKKRIVVPAAINAIPFYKKCGFEHVNQELNFHDGDFLMEMFPTV